MKHAIISILLVITLVALPALALSGINNQSAQAAPVVHCSDIKIGQTVHVKCTAAGVLVLDETLPLPVTTIKVPLPGQTVTVPVPGGTKTVQGPTKTVTAPGSNTTHTETVTISPPAQTVTVLAPTKTVTTTVTPAPTTPGQGGTTGGTITPPGNRPAIVIPSIQLNTPQVVGFGTLAVIIITCLILTGLYFGYYMGYKDSDKAERKFYKVLLGKK